MISTPELEPKSPIHEAFEVSRPCDECVQQLIAARRELGAFVIAVGKLYGEEAASDAADHWVSLAESSFELRSVGGFPDWRHISILAASRLTTNGRRSGRAEAQTEMGR